MNYFNIKIDINLYICAFIYFNKARSDNAMLKKIRKALEKYSFIKNIMVLMSGSGLALVIPFLVTPILTRFFSPEDFGLWGTYSAIVAVVSVIANGRYELAILLPDNKEDAFLVFSGSLLIAIVFSIILVFVNVFFGNSIAAAFDLPEIRAYLYFVPLSIILIAIRQAANYWHNRHKSFSILSYGKVIQSSSTAISNLGIGKFLYFPGGLIISTLVGQFLLAFYYLKKMRLKEVIPFFSLKKIKKILYEHREFPIKSGPGIFLNILKEQAPIFLFAIYFNQELVGFYSLIIRLFGTPLTLMAGSISQVYFQKAVELNKAKKAVYTLFKKTSIRLILIVILPLLFIAFWGEPLFGIVFGDEWQDAGKILVIFSFYYAVRFIISAQSSLLIVFKKLNIELLFNGLALLFQLSSLIIGGILEDYLLSLYLMAISGGILYTLLGIYFLFYLKRR
jgi:O-antigen/teichoic acid export membrane protein